jgi:hypothetical protein
MLNRRSLFDGNFSLLPPHGAGRKKLRRLRTGMKELGESRTPAPSGENNPSVFWLFWVVDEAPPWRI